MRTVSSVSAREAAELGTEALRRAFLVSGLFETGTVQTAMTELDRLLIGAAVPDTADLPLETCHELGTDFFTERREIGLFNLGGGGSLRVDGQRYELGPLDCLYIGRGSREVVFEPSINGHRPRFIFASCPAHSFFPTRLARVEEVAPEAIGDQARASRRLLRRFIHPGGICSAQLTMGFTHVPEGNAWNTMPSHTHSRRSEIYVYFDLGEEIVVHLIGPPYRTRHVIVRNEEAVLSPAWSIHMGAGTGSYKFVWIMAGENQRFDDMDPAPLQDIY